VQQVSYRGRTANAMMWFAYGHHANLPVDVLAQLVATSGRPESRIAFPGSPLERPTGGDPGDVFWFHPQTGSRFHFKANGEVEATCGKLTITGDLTVTGASALGSTVTSGGTDISDTHTHEGSPTAPTGAVSPTGAPI
jgi:phage gp45-like